MAEYYTSGQTDANFTSALTFNTYTGITALSTFYTKSQSNALLELRSSTGHTLASYGITDVYNTGQTVTLIALIQTGVTLLSQLVDVTIGSPSNTLISGHTLRWDKGIWVNSAITLDLSAYYTSAQVDIKFYTSAKTIALFSSTAHTHYLTGMTDTSHWTPSHGQYLMYSAGTWVPVTTSLGENYLVKSGDTMTGSLTFNFMSGSTSAGSTGWTLYVDNTGKLIRGSANISDFITGNTTLLEALINENYWSGTTFTGTCLSAYTILEGQRYVDKNYFYEYLNGTLYRTYYSIATHNHDSRYYTKTELLNTGVLDGRYLRSAATYSLVALTDVSITAATLTSNSYLKYNSTNSKWENYQLDMTLYTKVANSVSTGRTIIGVSGLCGGHDLTSNIYIMHLTGTPTASSPAATGIVIATITPDLFGHISSYTTSNLDTLYQPLGSMALDNLTDVAIASPLANQVLMYTFGAPGYWSNKSITMSTISDFSDSNYVHKIGSETITGTKTFSGAAVFNGGMSFTATTTLTIPHINLNDRVLYINYQSTKSNGLGANGKAGISIERGNYLSYTIYFDENAAISSTGGTLKAGLGFTGKTIALMNQVSHQGINVWDNQYGYVTNSTAFTYNSILNSLNIGPNITTEYSNSFTIGSGNTSSTDNTFTFGLYNINSGAYSVSFGVLNNTGFQCISQGTRNYIAASYSGGFGIDHNLIQNASLVGYSYAFGSGHTMDGTGTQDGQFCGAFGERNTVTGNWSFATGKRNTINSTAIYSAIIGGSGMTATLAETLYCKNFNHKGNILGFYNASGCTKPTALTTTLPELTGGTPASSLTNNYGWVDADSMTTAIEIIKNLQSRVNELEAKIKNLGLLS